MRDREVGRNQREPRIFSNHRFHQRGVYGERNEKSDMRINYNRSEGERTKKMQMLRNIEAKSFTVFVDNLPKSMTVSWLWQLFKGEGQVIDVFMPRKRRSSKPAPFAFFRYANKKGAMDAMENLNGMVIRGSIMAVQEAKYKRFTEKGTDSIQNKL